MTQKRWLTVLMAITLMVSLMAPAAMAEGTDEFLSKLEGTYDELFTVICAPEYDEVWLESCTKYAGEEKAQMYADMLKSACYGELYGAAAIEAYIDTEDAQFNCFFIEGVKKITVEGNRISGVDESGETVFSHAYSYIGDEETFGFALYQSADENSGEFTYFMFAPDTPEETYHIEFRYGSELEGMGEFYTGKYAYWLAAGILTPYTQEDIVDVIDLFCEENILAAEEEAAA